jgi:hypothetical protein
MKIALVTMCLCLCSCAANKCTLDEPEPVVVKAKGGNLCAKACAKMTSSLINDAGGVGCAEGNSVPAPDDVKNCDSGLCSQLVPCSEDATTAECVTCEWFCNYSHDQGSSWNTSCIVDKITKCSEIESVCAE